MHIVSSPEEAVKLRGKLSATEKDDFDIVIHGDEEHVRNEYDSELFGGPRDLLMSIRSTLYGRRTHIMRPSDTPYTSSTDATLRSLNESSTISIA